MSVPQATDVAIRTVTNPNTGRTHVSHREHRNPICGSKPHAQKAGLDRHCGTFPEDFGDLPDDCTACAALNVEDHVVELNDGGE